MQVPAGGDDWVALSGLPLPVEAVLQWAGRPGCGAVTSFLGTVRDHAEGRPGVVGLEYEAYEEAALARMAEVAGASRARWPTLGRVALLHRVGHLEVGAVSVVVVVSAPHRAEAFAAARYCIDTLKTSVPIWKREEWHGGSGWSSAAVDLAGEVG